MTVNQIFKGTPEAEIVDTTHALIVKLSEYIKYTKSEKENSMEQYLLYIAKKELTIIISKHINWNLLPQDTPVYVYYRDYITGTADSIAHPYYYSGEVSSENGECILYTDGKTSFSAKTKKIRGDWIVIPAVMFDNMNSGNFTNIHYGFLE